MNNTNKYNVRQMVTDSAIATIICLYIVTISYFNLIFSTLVLFVIPLTIGLYFKDKAFKRSVITSSVILLFSLFFIIFYHVILIIPNLILGVILVSLFNIENKRMFYIISIPIIYIVDTLNDIFHARFYLGINFYEFLTEHVFITNNTIINKYLGLFIVFYLILNLIISITKGIIIWRVSIIYSKKVRHIIEEPY